MNSLILCTAVTLNIFSAPAGNQVVGTVPANKEVQLMDGSLLRDWVFVGKPGPDGVSPRGWVIYAGLGLRKRLRHRSGSSRHRDRTTTTAHPSPCRRSSIR